MKRVYLALFCGLLGILATRVAGAPQVNGQIEIPTEKLVNALRTLNTAEYSYWERQGDSLIGRRCSPFCEKWRLEPVTD
jgi:hypothetical protein